MFWYEILTLIIDIFSLIASVAISFVIFKMSKRTEDNRYRMDVDYMARKFIIDQGDNEILYLPYCVIANAVNRHHKHIRKIYNEFDALPNDVQKEVLKQAGYDYSLIKDAAWVDSGLKQIENFAKKYDFGNTFLYDGEKYFRRAFSDHSSALTSKYKELEYLFDDKLEWLQGSSKAFNDTGKISFSSYIESYYRTFVLAENKKGFKKENVPKPLDYLIAIKDFYNCDEEELCFWMMVIVGELSYYVIRTRHGGFMNGVDIPGFISCGGAQSETFEDMYYKELMHLYDLKLDEQYFNNDKNKQE